MPAPENAPLVLTSKLVAQAPPHPMYRMSELPVAKLDAFVVTVQCSRINGVVHEIRFGLPRWP